LFYIQNVNGEVILNDLSDQTNKGEQLPAPPLFIILQLRRQE